MAPKEHHFLLFRHCPRTTSESVVPVVGTDLSDDVYEYVGAPKAAWEALGDNWCLSKSQDIMGNTGEWMITSGMIKPRQKVQWEILADDVIRDIDTAYYLSGGIRDGVEDLRVTASVGAETIKADGRFFSPTSYGLCETKYHHKDINNEIRSRLAHLPRPTMPISEALKMLEELGGQGELGDLSKILNVEPQLDEESGELDGAVNLLAEISEMMLYTRAGGLDPPFLPKANKQQVFEFLQFAHWMRGVTFFENTKQATRGAAQAQAMLRVLSQGWYQSPAASAEEDYDTRVTIIVGHDIDLDKLGTALGVRWILQEPFISGKDGAFVPTPPMSGIHAVRRFDNQTDQIDLSFVYHQYAEREHTDFVLNETGILEHAPLIFQQEFESSFVDDSSTHIYSRGSKTSVDFLKEHVLGVLSRYGPGAKDCFRSASSYWADMDQARASTTTSSPTNAPTQVPVVVQEVRVGDHNDMSFGAGILVGLLIAVFSWSLARFVCRLRSHRIISSSALKANPFQPVSSLDLTMDSSSSSASTSSTEYDDEEEESNCRETVRLVV